MFGFMIETILLVTYEIMKLCVLVDITGQEMTSTSGL